MSIDYRPPPAVVAAAKRALELIEYRGKGLLPETVRWARKIARGEPADEAKIIKGAAWHARHAVDRRPGWSNPPTHGYVAYLFWFGAPGKAWFNRLRKQIKRQHSTENSESGARKKRRTKKRSSRAGARPEVYVRIQGKCRKRRCPSIEGPALVDTGAAHSFFDAKAVRKLRLKNVGKGLIRGIAGGPKPIELKKYPVTLSFPELGIPDVPLLAQGAYAKPGRLKDTGTIALLGRDAMSGGDDPKAGMLVSYDGPSGKLRIQPSKVVLDAMQEEMIHAANRSF